MSVFTNVQKLALLGAALVSLGDAAAAQELRDVKMSLASTSFATVPPRLAEELGLFDQHGINMEFVVMDNASTATTAIISESADMAMSGPGEWISAQGRGIDVVVIARGYSGLSASLILSKAAAGKLALAADAPVAERLEALDGLLIASTTASGAYTVAFKGAAEAAGAEVRFTFMAQPAMNAALESGAVDGFIAGAPFWPVAVTKGAGVIWLSGPKGEVPVENTPVSTSGLQVMRGFAEANPQVVADTVAAIDDLAQAIDDRPADVRAALAVLYPNLDAATLDLLFATESASWKNRPWTEEEIVREIAFVKSTGLEAPHIDTLPPASLVFP